MYKELDNKNALYTDKDNKTRSKVPFYPLWEAPPAPQWSYPCLLKKKLAEYYKDI